MRKKTNFQKKGNWLMMGFGQWNKSGMVSQHLHYPDLAHDFSAL
jgi:hypothetical protein